MFFAVGAVSFGDNRLAFCVDAHNGVAVAAVFYEIFEFVVGIDRLFRNPKIMFTCSVIAHGPLCVEASDLCFRPIVPMLLVHISVVTDSAQTLAHLWVAGKFTRYPSFDLGNPDDYLLQDGNFPSLDSFLPKAHFFSNRIAHEKLLSFGCLYKIFTFYTTPF